jgi:hypothetical protein
MPISDPDGEQPGVSIRPLSHADLAALLAHLHQHDHDQDLDDDPGPAAPPVVAVRVRATVGRPGASAQATYGAAGPPSGRPGPAACPGVRPSCWPQAPASGCSLRSSPRSWPGWPDWWPRPLTWLLRFRVSPDALAWRRGAAGERRTARLLSRLEQRGWVVLHDLAVPGSPANIDHLAIGLGGVVVIDSKQYRGRLRLDAGGLLWHGRHLLTMMLRAVRWEADQADEVLGVADVDVACVVAVHGASVPWGGVTVGGVAVAPAGRVSDLLRARPPILTAEQVGWLADRARVRFRPAA